MQLTYQPNQNSLTGGSYKTSDKEFYLTSEQILFIRPGLALEILDVVIPADLQTESHLQDHRS